MNYHSYKPFNILLIFISIISSILPPASNLYITVGNTLTDVENQTESKSVFAVIVNAGSTGSRAVAFEFNQTSNGELELKKSKKFETEPGLSAYTDDPRIAVWSIAYLLSRAKTFVEQKYWDKTILQLRATAGLRQLEEKKSKHILDNLKQLFNESSFVTDDNSVDIMGGEDEGVFSWFTVNILQNHLVGDLNKTAAVIDLGGGSVQISYIPVSENNTEHCFYTYEMLDTDICLYSKSYPNLGLMSGREGTYTNITEYYRGSGIFEATSPCLHNDARVVKYTFGPKTFYVSGEENGSGINYELCMKTIESFFYSSQVDRITDIGDQEIVAISNFFYLAKEEGLVGEPNGDILVEAYYDAAKTECEKEFKNSDAFKCMDFLYIAVLLEKGFGLPKSTKINLLNTVDGHEVSWALGAAYHLLKPKVNKSPNDKDKIIID